MKLLSYINDGCEWGMVFEDAVSGHTYAIDPGKAIEYLNGYFSDHSIGLFVSRPRFYPGGIPHTMLELLEGGDELMAETHRLKNFIDTFIEQSDRTLINRAGKNIEDIEFLAPIPEPRLLWGLVSNTPAFIRARWWLDPVLPIPKGHQRPLGTVVAHNEETVNHNTTGGNAELGIIIGQKCRNVSARDALQYVAGYTVVNDMFDVLYFDQINEAKKRHNLENTANDMYTDISYSWTGKCSDRMCGIGPWLVTPDEVGNPYELLTYTSRNHERIGRGFTSSYLVGIERAICYYSSFATLYPGDVIHMGSVAKDGYSFRDRNDAETCLMQSMIERIGTLNFKSRLHGIDAEKAMPPRPRKGQIGVTIDTPRQLDEIRLRNFYIVYGNSRRTEPEPRPYTRFLCAPGSAVGSVYAESVFFDAELRVSAEICAVIGKSIRGISPEEVYDSLAGIAPMLVLENVSLHCPLEPYPASFPRERVLLGFNERWGDACNIVAGQFFQEGKISDLEMELEVADERITYSVRDYELDLSAVIADIARYISLYPGDVITLGRLGPTIDLEPRLREMKNIDVTLTAGTIRLDKNIVWSSGKVQWNA